MDSETLQKYSPEATVHTSDQGFGYKTPRDSISAKGGIYNHTTQFATALAVSVNLGHYGVHAFMGLENWQVKLICYCDTLPRNRVIRSKHL
jgi:hypothetical protein